MASFSFISFDILFLSLCLRLILLISPAHSLNCTSNKFNNNKVYDNCNDLTTLNAYLHYTYNSSNSSLSIAFKAPPAKPDGWVAWAINLNGNGMTGAEAFVGLKSTGDAVVVKKYNIVSYTKINETPKLSFDAWDLSAESDTDGNFVIFASVKVPEKVEKLNQIWQVGPSVNNEFPAKHDFGQANLLAKGTLDLVSSTTTSTGNNTSTTTTNGTNNTTTNDTNSNAAGYKIKELNLGFQIGVLFFLLVV